MPEQINYMAALDAWTEAHVITPLSKAIRLYVESLEDEGEAAYSAEAENALTRTTAQIKKAVRDKVLESYRNGQAAGPRKFQPRQ